MLNRIDKSKSQHSEFPERIEQFVFVRTLGEFDKGSSFNFALYNDEEKQEYVCKFYLGKKNTLKHKWIKNEIAAYKLLNQATAHSKSYSTQYNISIPQIYVVKETSQGILFLIDKIQGDPLNSKSTDIIIDTYQLLTNYLQSVSTHVDLRSTEIIKRNAGQYFVLFHYYSLRTLLKYPNLIALVLKSLPVFYKGIFKLGTERVKALVIRDMASDNNLFLNNGELTIIDLESATITHPLVQLSSFVIVESANKEFLYKFYNSPLMTEVRKNKKLLDIFKAMLIYGALVDIVATYRSDRDTIKDESVNLINLSIKLNEL